MSERGKPSVLIFHGYLLRGTGSNIYNAELASWLRRLGHQVHLFCQEGDPAQFDFVDAVGTWHQGRLEVRVIREPVLCTAYVPDIGRCLPVYVPDHYEGFEARPLSELADAQIENYIAANVAAVRDVVAAAKPDVAIANHVVMGPVILARALAGQVSYAVKIHGSALEYTLRPNRERFLPYAEEGLRPASAVLAGSRHTAESLWEVTGLPFLPARTRMLGPGVDVTKFRPRTPEQARRQLHGLAERLAGEQPTWGGEADGARALLAADPTTCRLVSYVGKLIVSKGVDLLIAAWPLVFDQAPDARLLIAGFGAYREALSDLVRALGDGDLDAMRSIARQGRALEGGPAGELRYLTAFLDELTGAARHRYLTSARAAATTIGFAGRIEHDDVSDLMAASDEVVIPSTFPEAFGMVLAEAACSGAIPISMSHSGLAEVTAVLAPTVPEDLRPKLAFDLGPGVVRDIAAKLLSWLELSQTSPDEARQARRALAAAAGHQFGWNDVAEGVVAAAQGRLDDLLPVQAVA